MKVARQHLEKKPFLLAGEFDVPKPHVEKRFARPLFCLIIVQQFKRTDDYLPPEEIHFAEVTVNGRGRSPQSFRHVPRRQGGETFRADQRKGGFDDLVTGN